MPIAFCLVGAMALLFGLDAHAAFEASELSSAGISHLLGVATDGSETGIYEIREAVEVGIGVLVGLVLVWAGYMIVRRIVRGAARG